MPWIVTRSDELYHHGILGQKWGDRNGPPYPLDRKDYSAKEKVLNSFRKIASKKLTHQEVLSNKKLINTINKTKEVQTLYNFWNDLENSSKNHISKDSIVSKYGGYSKVNQDAINKVNSIIRKEYGDRSNKFIEKHESGKTDQSYALLYEIWNNAD